MSATVFYDSHRISRYNCRMPGNKRCPEGCTCKRHQTHNSTGGSKPCPQGCTCKRHKSRNVNESERLCGRCNQVLPLELFPKNLVKGKYLSSWCQKCTNAYMRQHRQDNAEHYSKYEAARYRANREKIRERVRKNRTPEADRNLKLKYGYGLTLEAYDELLAQQEYVCAICKKPPNGKFKFLAVDHDHITGRIRGLLCTTCNLGLGALKDSKNILRAALAYLERGDA